TPGVPGWNFARGFVLAGPVDKDGQNSAELMPLNAASMGFFQLDVNAFDPKFHEHDIVNKTDGSLFTGYTHKHQVNFSISGSSGSSGVDSPGRNGQPLGFVSDLQVFVIQGTNTWNRTAEIRQQLASSNPIDWSDPAGNPKKIGDGGTGNDVLKEKGTGVIRLDFLPDIAFTEGEYC